MSAFVGFTGVAYVPGGPAIARGPVPTGAAEGRAENIAFLAGLVEGNGLILRTPAVELAAVVVNDALDVFSVGGEEGIEGDLVLEGS